MNHHGTEGHGRVVGVCVQGKQGGGTESKSEWSPRKVTSKDVIDDGQVFFCFFLAKSRLF